MSLDSLAARIQRLYDATKPRWQLIQGNCLEVVPTLGARRFRCIVTSPPYFGLRKYDIPDQTWTGATDHEHVWQSSIRPGQTGGTASAKVQIKGQDNFQIVAPSEQAVCTYCVEHSCDHEWEAQRRYVESGGGAIRSGEAFSLPGPENAARIKAARWREDASCRSCGAWQGQLGLEPTPEQYIQHLVEIFRACRETLTDDGTLWLVISDSMSGSGKGPTGWNGIGDQLARQGFVGSRRVRAYGNDDKGREGSTAPDSSYFDLCDGCQAALPLHTASTSQQHPEDASLSLPTSRDISRRDSEAASPVASVLDAPPSTTPESSPRLPADACAHCSNCGACLSVLRSASRDARLCVRRTDDIDDTVRPSGFWADRTRGKEPSSRAYGPPKVQPQYTLPGKNMLGIPWRVAIALQQDGWILRSAIIWEKPSVLPESVRDRPTKSYEYVFLLAKSSRYFYNLANAIEPAVQNGRVRADQFGGDKYGEATTMHSDGSVFTGSDTRQIRDVWRIGTEPTKHAHYAAFPTALAARCIALGSRPGDEVLDPFAGISRTGIAALRLRRSFVGVDLGQEYLSWGAQALEAEQR